MSLYESRRGKGTGRDGCGRTCGGYEIGAIKSAETQSTATACSGKGAKCGGRVRAGSRCEVGAAKGTTTPSTATAYDLTPTMMIMYENVPPPPTLSPTPPISRYRPPHLRTLPPGLGLPLRTLLPGLGQPSPPPSPPLSSSPISPPHSPPSPPPSNPSPQASNLYGYENPPRADPRKRLLDRFLHTPASTAKTEPPIDLYGYESTPRACRSEQEMLLGNFHDGPHDLEPIELDVTTASLVL